MGHLVTKIVATDEDFDDNGMVVFSMPEEAASGDAEYLSIDRETGEIFLQKSLKNIKKSYLEVSLMLFFF